MEGLTLRRAALVIALACLTLVAVACSGDGDKESPPSSGAEATAQSAGPFAGATVPPQPQPTTPAAQTEPSTPSTPSLPAPGEGAQLVRLVIPKAKVDNRVVVKGLNDRREMEDPGTRDDVAWYNFSALPGFGSNAVFSGHVDWYTGERGVFWFLRDLKEGDEAQVHYSDGTVLNYRITRVEVYGANDAPVAEITGPTSADRLTMITCDGVFQRGSGDYTQRRVVFAERVI